MLLVIGEYSTVKDQAGTAQMTGSLESMHKMGPHGLTQLVVESTAL